MCGIFGIIGSSATKEKLIAGLKTLEYRGYDSAGVALLADGALHVIRAEGKLSALEKKLEHAKQQSALGIGHTRWATHGVPSEANAHPHATEEVAVVHNGIIENFNELKKELQKQGVTFRSQTDSEVITQLIDFELKQNRAPKAALFAALKRLHGAYGIAVIFRKMPEVMFAARQGSPLVIGFGKRENYIASDAMAFADDAQDITYLNDGDVAEITTREVAIYTSAGKKIARPRVKHTLLAAATGKGNFPHYMLKEIFEQPRVAGEVLTHYFDKKTHAVALPKSKISPQKMDRIWITACGTSYYAGSVARYWLEEFAQVPCEVEIASEFRYRELVLPKKGGVAIGISQSGETADTLAALRFAKSKKQAVASVLNVATSTMGRESDLVLPIHAGPEIGVASTKAFTAQLMTLAMFVLALAKARGAMDEEAIRQASFAMIDVPSLMEEVLAKHDQLATIGKRLAKARDILYTGRGTAYPVAMEGALKIKEISYINAQAIAAGELKHGTIAIIDEKMPVVVVAPSNRLFEKTASNVREIAARKGQIILLSDKEGIEALSDVITESFEMPKMHPLVEPLLYALPVQLMAYYAASSLGRDVDQPRNLAKSVTVE